MAKIQLNGKKVTIKPKVTIHNLLKRFKLNDEYDNLKRSLYIKIISRPSGLFLIDLKCPDRDITQAEIANAKEDMPDKKKQKINEKKLKKESCFRKHRGDLLKTRKCISKIK